MSTNRLSVPEIFRSALLVCTLATCTLIAASSARASSADEGVCASAIPVELGSVPLGSVHRGFGDHLGGPLFFRLNIPSAGILSMDVSAPGDALAEPKIGFADPGCDTAKRNSRPAVLERSATHMTLVARAPGAYFVRVASEDPLLPLGEFKLRTAFLPDAPGAPSFAQYEEDEEEIEIDANPLIFPGIYEEDEEEIEIDANPLIFRGQDKGSSLSAKLDELCRRAESDDHGDSLTCATYLRPGQDMAGEIHNGWGDDDDVFLFVLDGSRPSRLWTLEIEISGDVDAVGRLYDRFGQRLARSDGGDSGGNTRIVRTLGPGVYFVRVAGRQGSEGLYTLRVDASPW